MKLAVVTLFPEMFEALNYGIPGKALRQQLFSLSIVNPREFALDPHHTVDDRPYGGGPGMVMMVEPLAKAIDKSKEMVGVSAPVLYLSPQGKTLTQEDVQILSARKNMILVSGRYEGIDERVVNSKIDEEWSIGDYVLSGGELPAMVLIDALIRLLPGALGHVQSAQQDSFVEGLLDYPHYTRPEIALEQAIPSILKSGNHQAIKRWRLKQSLGRTWLKRPDLLAKLNLNKEQHDLLTEFIEEQQQ